MWGLIMSNILDYWYEIEFFNPTWPVANNDIDLLNRPLPWPAKHNENEQVSFDIYIGKAKSEDLINWMFEKLNLQNEQPEYNGSHSCLCAFKVDAYGIYIPDSFALSGFIWGICDIVLNDGHTKLDRTVFQHLQNIINKYLSIEYLEKYVPIDKNNIQDIFDKICDRLSIKENNLITYSVWTKKQIQLGKKTKENPDEYIFPPIPPSTELISSFYLKDIEKVKSSPTKQIEKYINSLDSANSQNRIEIDTNTDEMKKWLTADKYPLGIWPSIYHPCLMQQVGINISTSDEQQIFSINGPPGTGKTTLLKEIIVSNIVQRAKEISKFDTPDDAFSMKKFVNPPDIYNGSYYVPDPSLTKYGIIVASNNNSAVENISVELPKRVKKDRTGYFSDKDNDIYFTDIACRLTEADSWGLISAKLGKKENIKHLCQVLNGTKEQKGLFNYYKEIPNWETARNDFNSSLEDVLEFQRNICTAQEELLKYQKISSDIKTIENELQILSKEIDCCNENLYSIKEKIQSLEQLKEKNDINIQYLLSEIPFFKKQFPKLFKNNTLIVKLHDLEEENVTIVLELINQNNTLFDKKSSLSDLQNQYETIQARLNLKRENLNEIQLKLDSYETYLNLKIPYEDFWDNISENEQSQECSPWTCDLYDEKREELFYKAMMLHKAFVLNSNSVKQNIQRLTKTMWNDKFSLSDKKLAYSALLNTLQILIPVISTTFASVETFFDCIGKEELGTLIIDEAGQATPQSALGVIWRSKKTIIVGDPLQIEPISTIPRNLQIQLADKHNIPSNYRTTDLSVQILGDACNNYGGYRFFNDEKIWLGCPLILHRRCLDPMFTISNKIAYNERMFQKTEQSKKGIKLTLEKSYWLDVKGKMIEKGNQNVAEQNDNAIKLFEKALEKQQSLPNLYIITPFKKISYELGKQLSPIIKKHLKNLDEPDIQEYIKTHCGTIHTFQGKEANEVILVLGCDTTLGKNAATWVGQKPNIINVAVSRAKYNICIIGDYDQWKHIQYVNTACQNLDRIIPS